MKREWMKWLKLAAELLIIAAVVWVVVFFLQGMGIADGAYESEAWVICQPGKYVNVRRNPGKQAEVIGWFNAGDSFRTDWEIRDGWVHAYVSLEETEGWIYVGYVTAYEPEWREGTEAEIEADGRVACREYCGGPRISGRGGWVKPGDTVQVWYWTPEWAVTNRGYIQADYLAERK